MKIALNLAMALVAGMALAADKNDKAKAADGEKGGAAAAERAARQAEARSRRMLNQALSTLADGEEERGISLLEAVPKMFPGTENAFRAWLELGRVHAAKSRTEEAQAALRKADGAKSSEIRAEALLLLARVQIAGGRDSEASMLLRRITTDFPDSPFANDAWFEIGQIHFKAKRWMRAQEAFRRVGTAVPRPGADGDKSAAVFAEAGQRLYVCVDDRDIAVATALGKKVEVEVAAASGDRERVELKPFGTGGLSALASVPTSVTAGQPGDGVLTVQGGENVTVTYVDAANAAGERNVKLTAPVRIVSSAVLAVMDGAYRQSVKGVFAGNPAFLRLRDLDLDTSANKDSVTVAVKSYRRRPKPTDDEIAEAAAKGETIDTEADPWIEITTGEVTLTETAPRSGVFEGRLTPVLGEAGPGEISAAADGKLAFSYVDKLNLDGAKPRELTTEVAVLSGGSAEPQSIVSSASDPVLQCRKLLLEAKLLNQWATIFKDVGLDQQAAAKADEGLGRVEEIFAISRRQAVLRDVLEQAYAAKWDLLLVKNKLDEAISVCRELLRVYPDTLLADIAFLRIAKARAESRDANGLDEAARIYRSVLAMPNSPNRAEAQYLLAGVLEKIAKRSAAGAKRKPDFTAAIAAYRACAENFPQSAFAGESFKRIVAWQTEKKDYARAVETLERVMQDYPDAPWLDEMLLRWGIVCFRQGDKAGAVAKFNRVLEEYPSGSAAAQAKSFIERLR